MQNTAIQKLNHARADNWILYCLMIFLGGVSSCGIYLTIDEVGRDTSNRGPLPHEMVARRPQRLRRREMEIADTTGNGIKKNAYVGSN